MDKCKKERLLGSGTFGKVWLVKLNKVYYGMKEIKLNAMKENERQMAFNEVSVLSRCKHKNIIRYKEALIDHHTGILSIFMEYADGGDMSIAIAKQRGSPFPEHTVISWFIQICLGLQYIHKQNILHRDLKTQNIFLTRNKTVKIGDFGIARVLLNSEDLVMTAVGTPYYLSPEICMGKPYNFKTDMWSLGCVLFEISALERPFKASNLPELLDFILNGKRRSYPTWCSILMQQLVDDLLCYDPVERPSTQEILAYPSLQQHISLYVHRNPKDTLYNEILPTPSKLPKFCMKRRALSTSGESTNISKIRKVLNKNIENERKPRSSSAVSTPPSINIKICDSQSSDKVQKYRKISRIKSDMNVTYIVTAKNPDKNCEPTEVFFDSTPTDIDCGYLSEDVYRSSEANSGMVYQHSDLNNESNIQDSLLDMPRDKSHCHHSQCNQCIIDMLWKNRIRGYVGAQANNSEYSKLKNKLLLIFQKDMFQKVYDSLIRDWERNEQNPSEASIRSFLQSLTYDQVQHIPLMMQLIQLDLLRNSKPTYLGML